MAIARRVAPPRASDVNVRGCPWRLRYTRELVPGHASLSSIARFARWLGPLAADENMSFKHQTNVSAHTSPRCAAIPPAPRQ